MLGRGKFAFNLISQRFNLDLLLFALWEVQRRDARVPAKKKTSELWQLEDSWLTGYVGRYPTTISPSDVDEKPIFC